MRHIDSIVLFFNEMKRRSDEIIAKLSEELQELVLKDGSKLAIDAEGTVTKDGETVADGEYELESGEIAIVEEGKYKGTKTEEEPTEQPTEQEDEPTEQPAEEPTHTAQLTIGEETYDVDEAVVTFVEGLQAEIESLKEEVEKLKAEMTKPADSNIEQNAHRQNYAWLNALK